MRSQQISTRLALVRARDHGPDMDCVTVATAEDDSEEAVDDLSNLVEPLDPLHYSLSGLTPRGRQMAHSLSLATLSCSMDDHS